LGLKYFLAHCKHKLPKPTDAHNWTDATNFTDFNTVCWLRIHVYIHERRLTQLTYVDIKRRLHVSTIYSHHQTLCISSCMNYSNYCALGIPVLQKYVTNIKVKMANYYFHQFYVECILLQHWDPKRAIINVICTAAYNKARWWLYIVETYNLLFVSPYVSCVRLLLWIYTCWR
jgi:hypothetical protein